MRDLVTPKMNHRQGDYSKFTNANKKTVQKNHRRFRNQLEAVVEANGDFIEVLYYSVFQDNCNFGEKKISPKFRQQITNRSCIYIYTYADRTSRRGNIFNTILETLTHNKH